MNENELKVRSGYMIAIYLTCWLTCFSMGFPLTGYNTAGMVIERQLGWSNNITTFITTSGVVGLMFGSFLCKFFLPCGRINTVYIA